MLTAHPHGHGAGGWIGEGDWAEAAMRHVLMVSIAAGLLLVLVVGGVAVGAAQQPEYQLSPASAPPGTTIAVSGTDCDPTTVDPVDGRHGTFAFVTDPEGSFAGQEQAAIFAETDGSWSVDFVVPEVAPGVYDTGRTCDDGGTGLLGWPDDPGYRTFEVTADAPPPSPTPTPAPPGGSTAFDGDPRTTEAVDESDPTAAAVALSQLRFTATDAVAPTVLGGGRAPVAAQHVVLSRDDAFPDSLAGAPLSVDGPLLFTASADLAPVSAAEVDRVLPPGGTVYLLGGEQAIAPAVQQALVARGYAVQRLAGASRMETSVAVADEVRRRAPGTTVAVARAFGAGEDPTSGWADSVTGGHGRPPRGRPCWSPLARSSTPPSPIGSRLTRPRAPCSSAAPRRSRRPSSRRCPGPERVAGDERAGTAAAVAERLWAQDPSGPRRYVVINGFHPFGWAFGLAAGGVAADEGAPLVVVGDAVPAGTAAAVGTCGDAATDLLLIGDTSIIGPAVRAELERLDGGAC